MSNVASRFYGCPMCYEAVPQSGTYANQGSMGVLNSRFGVNQYNERDNKSSLYSYEITRQNYIVNEKVPFWRTAGGCTRSSRQNLNMYTDFPGKDCNTFEGTLFDIDAYPTYGEFWSTLSRSMHLNAQCGNATIGPARCTHYPNTFEHDPYHEWWKIREPNRIRREIGRAHV